MNANNLSRDAESFLRTHVFASHWDKAERDLAALLTAYQPAWVRAAEQLPEAGVPLLVWTVASTVYPEYGYWNDPSKFREEGIWRLPGRGYFNREYVVAWQLLPPGPDE